MELKLYLRLIHLCCKFIGLRLNDIFISASAVQIDHASVEEIFKHSKEVMTTMGEWELVGLTVKKFQAQAGDGEMYEEIRFIVSLNFRF